MCNTIVIFDFLIIICQPFWKYYIFWCLLPYVFKTFLNILYLYTEWMQNFIRNYVVKNLWQDFMEICTQKQFSWLVNGSKFPIRNNFIELGLYYDCVLSWDRYIMIVFCPKIEIKKTNTTKKKFSFKKSHILLALFLTQCTNKSSVKKSERFYLK